MSRVFLRSSKDDYLAFPILNIFVPQTGHTP